MCYDQKILCPRCGKRHKRGHVGKLRVCDRPYETNRGKAIKEHGKLALDDAEEELHREERRV